MSIYLVSVHPKPHTFSIAQWRAIFRKYLLRLSSSSSRVGLHHHHHQFHKSTVPTRRLSHYYDYYTIRYVHVHSQTTLM